MQRKISKLGRKTGLKNKELKKMCRFSLSGLLAVAVASLTGCLQTNRTYQSEPAADQSQNLTPAGTVKPAGETQSATEPEAPKPEKKDVGVVPLLEL
ncbi:MAG: hypothetical protein HY746_09590 [Elusimicrobia bacterium]|nr:hypothetical protein [Elusimicrobiota bacterium]